MDVSKDGTTTNTVTSSVANTKKEHVEWCEIEYGYDHNGDYMMHFTSHHERRLFPTNVDFINKVIINYLDKVIPVEIEKKFYPSPENWEKKVISVRAVGAQNLWSFHEEDVIAQMRVIAGIINGEIVKANPPKRLF